MYFKCIYLNTSKWNRLAAERSTEEAREILSDSSLEAEEEGREWATGFSVSQKLRANISSAQNASLRVIYKERKYKISKKSAH